MADSLRVLFCCCLLAGLAGAAHAQFKVPTQPPSLCGGVNEKPCAIGGCDDTDRGSPPIPLKESGGRCLLAEQPVAGRSKAVAPEEVEVTLLGDAGREFGALLALHQALDGARACPRGQRQTLGGKPVSMEQLNLLASWLQQERALLAQIHEMPVHRLAELWASGQLAGDADKEEVAQAVQIHQQIVVGIGLGALGRLIDQRDHAPFGSTAHRACTVNLRCSRCSSGQDKVL